MPVSRLVAPWSDTSYEERLSENFPGQTSSINRKSVTPGVSVSLPPQHPITTRSHLRMVSTELPELTPEMNTEIRRAQRSRGEVRHDMTRHDLN